MVKSGNTRDLKSLAFGLPGSSPGVRTKCKCGNDIGPFAPFVQMAKRTTGNDTGLKCCECYDKERITNE